MQSDKLYNMGRFSQHGMLLPKHPLVYYISCLSEVRQAKGYQQLLQVIILPWTRNRTSQTGKPGTVYC